MALSPGDAQRAPVCWLCFLDRVITRLDDESRCPLHSLVRDRVLGFIQIDERFLTQRPER